MENLNKLQGEMERISDLEGRADNFRGCKVMKHMIEVKYEVKNEKCDMHLIIVPETENRGEAIFKEIMAVNFAEQINGKNSQTQGRQHIPSRVNKNNLTHTHIFVKQ